jgi:nitrite reductase/ring-hydroxylating ferredoxin subunit
MRVARNLFRFSTILKQKIPTIANNQKTFKFGLLGAMGFGTAYWLSTKKVFNDEVATFETPDDIPEGDMREIQVGPKEEDTIIVYKHHGRVYATQSKCAHFGFSLAKGFLSGDKIMCPLHNAGFSIKTGKPDQGPVFNGIRTFETEVKNGKIIVRVPKDTWNQAPP